MNVTAYVIEMFWVFGIVTMFKQQHAKNYILSLRDNSNILLSAQQPPSAWKKKNSEYLVNMDATYSQNII